jgi:hypothetical protein
MLETWEASIEFVRRARGKKVQVIETARLLGWLEKRAPPKIAVH